MKRLGMVLALLLVATACSGSDADSTTTGAPAVTSTTAASGGGLTTTTPDTTTSTSASAGGDTTTSVDSTTTTTASTSSTSTTATTIGPPPAGAVFVISRVIFGDGGYVSVTNVGSDGGNLEGWQLCQRPAYYAIGSIEVAPGETVHFADGDVPGLSGQIVDAGGRFGPVRDSGGEIGLYADNSFSSSASIRSYVEWGSSPHGRSSVAWQAGIWPQDAFVESAGAPGIAATTAIPTSAADWTSS